LVPKNLTTDSFNTLGMPEGGMRLVVINTRKLAPALVLRDEVVARYLAPKDVPVCQPSCAV
jgi:hypothetical protein